MARRRHIVSSVDRLPDNVRREIAAARARGVTLDNILLMIRKLGGDVSRSALGRTLRRWDHETAGTLLRDARVVARTMVESIAEGDDSRVDEMNVELVQALIMRLLTRTEDGEVVSIDGKELELITRALSHAAAARKNSVEWRSKVRKEEQEKAKAAAAEKVELVGRARGISADAIKAMRDAVLGADA